MIHKYLSVLSCSSPVLGFTTILTLFPAAIYGCASTGETSGPTETVVRVMETRSTPLTYAESIDIMMFNDDRLRRLDTYQRFEMTQCSTFKPASSAGDKLMAVIVNSQKDRYGWTDICSYDNLSETYVNLEDETEKSMCMTGESSIRAGMPLNLTVQRLSSEVVLRSISCDFNGKPYEGQTIDNAKVYLTNVNAEMPVIPESPVLPRRIVNAGGLVPSDMEGFKEPGMLVHELPLHIGPSVIRPEARLRCYPNEAEEESAGAPFTRLVLEGEVNGKTYYWPVNINRTDGGNGISRNNIYIYDLRIKRLGNTDPDIPIELEDAAITMEIQEWYEEEEYGVRF